MAVAKFCDIQKRSSTKNAVGESVEVFDLIAERVWVQIKPLSGRRVLEQSGVHGFVTHELTLRYTTSFTLTQANRIKIDTRYFLISAVLNVGERNREWLVLCTEQLSTTDN